MKKRLYRSNSNVMVAGVLAGAAEYFDQDPTIWRIGFLILLIATGLMPGVLVYLICWVVMPVAPTFSYTEVKRDESATASDAENSTNDESRA